MSLFKVEEEVTANTNENRKTIHCPQFDPESYSTGIGLDFQLFHNLIETSNCPSEPQKMVNFKATKTRNDETNRTV